jgi:hypothetical protein
LGNTLIGQVIAADNEGAAYRVFEFKNKDGETKRAVGLTIRSVNQGVVDVQGFGPAVVEAFQESVYFDELAFDWAEFKVPEVGDYIKLIGSYTRKRKRLSKSKNPELKKGFWAIQFKFLNPSAIRVKALPPKPTVDEIRKRSRTASTANAV